MYSASQHKTAHATARSWGHQREHPNARAKQCTLHRLVFIHFVYACVRACTSGDVAIDPSTCVLLIVEIPDANPG